MGIELCYVGCEWHVMTKTTNHARWLRRATLILVALTGQLYAQTSPVTFQYFYDDLGQLVKVIDSSNNEVDYTYDAVGNITAITRSSGPATGSLAILNFTPQQGNNGETVTLYGQGFSPTPGANTVQFNGLQATVSTATATTLTVTVPTSATTGPITVEVGTATVSTTPMNFTIVPLPVISSISRKSALFNTSFSGVGVTGSRLTGATLSFNTAAVIPAVVAINSSGTSGTMSLTVGSVAGIYALVATNDAGSSSPVVTAANRFTVVDPNSTADSDGDGVPDVIEAALGTDPLDANSFPDLTGPPSSGEADSVPVFSTLNTFLANGMSFEADSAPVFSVLNTFLPGGTLFEAEGVPVFSVLNTSTGAIQQANEADSILFSVQNLSGNAATKPPRLRDSDGDGYPDELEWLLGSDPNDPNSIPQVHGPGEVQSPVFTIVNRQPDQAGNAQEPDSQGGQHVAPNVPPGASGLLTKPLSRAQTAPGSRTVR